MDEFTAAARFVHFAAVTLLFGAALFQLYGGIEEEGGTEQARSFARWLRAVLSFAAWAALLSAIAWLDSLAASMGGDWTEALNPETVGAVLFDTQFGHVWLWRLVLAVIVVGMLFAPSRSRGARQYALITGLSGAMVASLAGVGHAAMHTGPEGITHQIAHAVHLLAGGAWLGGLVPLGYVLARALKSREPEWTALARRAVPRFSFIGYFAVALVLASGCVNTFMLSGSVASLTGTDYGRVLIAKICLFLLMVGVAVVNRVVLAPRLASAEGKDVNPPMAALSRNVVIEQTLGVFVIALASVLGILVPPH